MVGTKKHPPDHCMALNPFADYFNHTDQGCDVTVGPTGYRVMTDQVIEKGCEIYISYRNHSNDFLLAEYGFISPKNKWDEVRLDYYILLDMTRKQREQLKDSDHFGKYTLDREAVCYRTQVALRLLFVPLKN
jgi:hypothetical protein